LGKAAYEKQSWQVAFFIGQVLKNLIGG
jgi:hypothetical protein